MKLKIWFSKSISVCSMKTLALTYRWCKRDHQLEIEFYCTLVKNDFLLVCTEIVAMKILVFRSSRLEVFCKKVVLRNFTKFTGKYLCQSFFFNKAAGVRSATLLKKRLWHMCFPVNFVRFPRISFYIEHFWWLLINLVIDAA